jgi:hypothetical protein
MISNQVRHEIYCEMWRAVEFTAMNVQYLYASMDVTKPYSVKDIDVFVLSFVMEM